MLHVAISGQTISYDLKGNTGLTFVDSS